MTQQVDTAPTPSRSHDGRFVVAASARDVGADVLWAALRKAIAIDTPAGGRPRSDPIRGARAVVTSGTAATLRAIQGAMDAGAGRVVVIDLALLADGPQTRPAGEAGLTERIATLRRSHPDVEMQLIGASGDERHATEVIRALRAPQPVREALADRALGRVFGGEPAALGRFLTALREGLPPDTRLALRGSAVSGRSYEKQTRFDARGPGTSDLDIVAIGEAAGRLWVDEARLLGGINSLPLCDGSRWVAPALDPARVRAQAVVGRPVSVQSMAEWFLQLRASVQGTPYLLLDEP